MDKMQIRPGRFVLIVALLAGITGCAQLTDGSQLDTDPAIGALPEDAAEIVAAAKPKPVPMIDSTAPDVFQATDFAIWDGKPTFGDIWIAMADLKQPERVEIRNEETGEIFKGSLLADDRPPYPDAPIRLSSGAALALGAAPLVPVRITVTAVRKTPVHETASLEATPVAPSPSSEHADTPDMPSVTRFDTADAPPDLNPPGLSDGFIEIAQSLDPAEAVRVADDLSAQAIPTQVQEDFVDGQSHVRIYAATNIDATTLVRSLSALETPDTIETAPETQVADVARIIDLQSDDDSGWIEVGAFPSRNEAMSVVQKLSRTAVPTEVCNQNAGMETTYRVFAGPADAPRSELDGSARAQVTDAFCQGVAANNTGDLLSSIQSASAPETGKTAVPEPALIATPPTAVRIRVGESTGDLNLRVPNPYSQPVLVPVGDVLVTIPKTASPELVDAIRRALETVDQ